MSRVAFALCALTPLSAAAHLELLQPAARYPETAQNLLDLKDGPCGKATNPPSAVPRTNFAAGATITVRWDEFVPHPGHFRIAFDPDGDDDLLDPAGYDDFYTPGVQVLEDNIPNRSGTGMHEMDITLPDIECDTCTLQVIQVMTDKPPWGLAGGNDIYYQCADLVLSVAGSSGTGTTGGGSTTGSTSTSSSSTGSSSTSSSGSATTTSSSGEPTTGPPDTDGGTGGSSDGGGCSALADNRAPAVAFVLPMLAVARRRRQ